MSSSQRVARIVTGIALVIVLGTSLLGGQGVALFALGLYAMLPYALILALGRRARDPWVPGGAGLAALAVEIGVRIGVLVYPQSSTDVVALGFSPIFIGAVAVPIGAGLGFISGHVWR